MSFRVNNSIAQTITSAGNVGIGTTAPAQILHTKTSGASNNTYLTTAGENNVGLWFANDYDTTPNFAGILFEQASDLLKIFNAQSAVSHLVIDNSGNVGIGTSSPSCKVEILDSTTQLLLNSKISDLTNKTIRIGAKHYTNAEEPVGLIFSNNTSTVNDVRIGGGTGVFNAATSISFYTAANNTTTEGTQRMIIDSSGNVGIGTTSPDAKLDVAGDINATKSIRVGDNIIEVTDNKTLALTDNGYLQKFNSATDYTLTVPPESDVDFPIGTEIPVTQYNTGTVTIAEGLGVTINSLDDNLVINGRYATVTLKKMGSDEWLLVGNLTT